MRRRGDVTAVDGPSPSPAGLGLGLGPRRAPAVGSVMRFAFKTAPQNTTWADMLAVWREGDQIEAFESGWSFDHFYPIFGDSTGPCLEGWTTLAALAQATRRLRLGVLVTGIHYRHPAVLANMAAAIDIVSDGRLELGLGAGWNEEESGAYGIELGSRRERSDRLEEACQVVISLLSQETTTFDGTYYQLEDARNEPKGPQRPHPPICIGGSGEKRTLRTTALYAQHWNFVGGPVEEFARKRDVLHAHCADVGRDPREITLSSHVRLGPGGAIGPALDTAAALGEEGLDLAIFTLPPPHDPAVLTRLAEGLSQLR
jgi:F420-dependent oxidoreductase-like protein